ncbi:MAG: type II secretion system protein [Elainellaceae cyanobacterium]
MQRHREWNPLDRFGVRKLAQRLTPLRKVRPHHLKKATIASAPSASGFSMLEMITVMAIAGIVLAIAAPGWISFHNTWQLNAAQDEVYQAFRQAQSEAKRRNLRWQVSFQNVDGQGQYALHPVTVPPMLATWSELPDGVQLDPRRTTLRPQNGVYKLQFNHQGHVNGQLGRVSLMGRERMQTRRSVLASTLIGAVRKANN